MLSSKDAVIACEGLTLRHGRHVIAQTVELSFGVGISVILGPNGAGKTTLLRALAALGARGAGVIRIEGVEASATASSRRRFFRSMGYMPQDWRHVPGYTVAESVEYAAWLKRIGSHAISGAVTRAIDDVGLGMNRRTRVSRLSGGAQQRVGLAEAIVGQPRILVLDEPTVGLDPEQRLQFRSILKARREDSCILLSTHLTDDASALADRIVVLSNAGIVFDGSIDELSEIGRTSVPNHGTALENGYVAVLRAASGA